MDREEKILNNQGLIGYTINKLGLRSLYYELVDVGQIGLIKAVDTFEETKNSSFGSYAYICIRNEVLMEMRKQRLTVSLEEPIADNLKREDTIKDDYDFVEDILKNDLLNQIYNNLYILTNVEREALIRYYGMFGTEKQRQVDIAKALNMSQANFSRIIKRAVNKLKRKLVK